MGNFKTKASDEGIRKAEINTAALMRITLDGVAYFVPEEIATEIRRLEKMVLDERNAHKEITETLTSDLDKQIERITANLFADKGGNEKVMLHDYNDYEVDRYGEMRFPFRNIVRERIKSALLGYRVDGKPFD